MSPIYFLRIRAGSKMRSMFLSNEKKRLACALFNMRILSPNNIFGMFTRETR
jgi:hypothetical protein